LDLREIEVPTPCLSKKKNLKPSEIGKIVLHWLNKQENWLLVIDNLDDAYTNTLLKSLTKYLRHA